MSSRSAKSNGNGKRRCRGINKRGEPCQGNPWANGYCIAHQPEEVKAAVGHKSGTKDGSVHRDGRRRDPVKVPELAKRLVEANAVYILMPYFKALGLVPKRHKPTGQIVVVPDPKVRARIYGVSREGVVRMSNYDDLESMMKAAERLFDRIYGKPKQALTLGGEDGGAPVQVAVPTSQERAAEVAQILAVSGAVRPPASGNGHG